MARIIAICGMVAILAGAGVYFVHALNPPPLPLRNHDPASLGDGGAAPVTVSEVRERRARENLDIVGAVRTSKQAAITTTYPGRVAAVLVGDGDSVRQGEPLIQLDVSQGRSQVQGAQAAVAAAQAQYRKAVDGKEARRVEMDADVSQALGGLRTAQARLKQAKL